LFRGIGQLEGKGRVIAALIRKIGLMGNGIRYIFYNFKVYNNKVYT